MTIFNNWRKYIPYLYLYIQMPFVSISTSILHRRLECREFEFVALNIRIFKWKFQFGLYDTERRIRQR